MKAKMQHHLLYADVIQMQHLLSELILRGKMQYEFFDVLTVLETNKEGNKRLEMGNMLKTKRRILPRKADWVPLLQTKSLTMIFNKVETSKSDSN